MSGSDGEDSLEKLITDVQKQQTSKKQITQHSCQSQQPKAPAQSKFLASGSKPRTAAATASSRTGSTRDRSISPEGDDDPFDFNDSKPFATSGPTEQSTVKNPATTPSTNIGFPTGFPLSTTKPKTNPNANFLLGGSSNEANKFKTGPAPPTSIKNVSSHSPKSNVKLSNRQDDEIGTKESTLGRGIGSSINKTSTTKSNLDWLGGSESPIPSADPSPIPTRKFDSKTGNESFDINKVISNPGHKSQFEPGDSSKMSGGHDFKPLPPFPKVSENTKPNDQIQHPELPPFLEKLTRERQAENQGLSNLGSVTAQADPTNSEQQHRVSMNSAESGNVRRRVIVKKSGPGAIVNSSVGNMSGAGGAQATLQLPSHIIDEDELKKMSSSLKLLYENQLEMVEKGYKDQIECLNQSHLRKEEMFRDEIKIIHKDYEDRIQRLKAELAEIDEKPIVRSNSKNYEILSELQAIGEEMKTLTGGLGKDSTRNIGSALLDVKDELNRMLDVKLSSFLTTAITSLKEMGSDDTVQKNAIALHEQLNQMNAEMQRHMKSDDEKRQREQANVLDYMSELSKILKEQKKLREQLMKSNVTTMAQSIETKHEDNRKREKISTQLREFRRDFQRVMNELELKHNSLQKSQNTIEGEQKHISQGFHELSTWLQLNWTLQQQQSAQQSTISNPIVLEHPNSRYIQQQSQSSIQNEFEFQMLKDERNSLSQTIAQINVDKRKLYDEKVELEGERRELERKRATLHELETTLRNKIADADDTKRQAEVLRTEHVRLNGELSKKMTEVEKERIRFRETTQTIDLQNTLQNQRNAEERAEILREREFLEKLRLQFLCPACLKLVRNQGDVNLLKNPQFQYNVTSSTPASKTSGTGMLDKSPINNHFNDIEKEGRQLKEMILNYYGGENAHDIFKLPYNN